MLKKILCIFIAIMTICSMFSLNGYATNEFEQDGYILDIPDVEKPVGIRRNDSFNNVADTSKEVVNSRSAVAHDYRFVGIKSYKNLFLTYDYYVYKDVYNWICLTGLNLTRAIQHFKNTGDKSLAFSIAQTYSAQTANEFSTSLGGEAGVDKMVTACVDFNYGIAVTLGREYQISSTVEATIPASANSGYYKMHVCHNYYAMKIEQRKTDGTLKETREVAMPYGESYATVLYSTDAATWTLWGAN